VLKVETVEVTGDKAASLRLGARKRRADPAGGTTEYFHSGLEASLVNSAHEEVALVEDALHANAPHLGQISGHGWSFSVNVRPGSHANPDEQFVFEIPMIRLSFNFGWRASCCRPQGKWACLR
jgi:hypothetical protein